MALMLLVTVSPCTASSWKYDSIKDNPEIKQMMEAYNEHIKSNFILMSYLNQIVSSPSRLLESLKEQDCDEDILDFVENNKSFTLALTHIRIVLLLKSAQSNDQEIMYVTNMVQTGEFRYANASEITKTNHEIKNEIEEPKRAQIEKDRLIVELQDAIAEVKTLNRLLPICSHCKNIRDDKGYSRSNPAGRANKNKGLQIFL